MRSLTLWLALGLGFVSLLPAQEPAPASAQPTAVPGAYVVQFRERSFDLEPFRDAIRAGRSAAEIAQIVARMEESVRADQLGFVREVEALGGRVTHQWWIINGAAVGDVVGPAVERLTALPNVASVEPVVLHEALNNTARNSTHHEADQANLRRDAQGQPVLGTGVTVAILDTGVDARFGGSGTPNRAYFVGGNTANNTSGGLGGSRLRVVFGAASSTDTEDAHGHGSHVSGSVASDDSTYRGIAPGAWLAGVKITTSSSGNASTTSIVNGWQWVAAQRAAYDIRVANNSFSGSPSLTDPIQVALDNTARNADVLICCAAGNSGSNTSSSQNVWNGLAVGSLDKNSLAVSSYSGTGPLDGFGRTYPDIACVGRSVLSILRDSTAGSSSSGTSMASPMASGGAALVRSAVPTISAIEAKAILLNTTKFNRTSRNTYGLGVMDCDAAVAQALAGDYQTVQLPPGSTPYSLLFTAAASGTLPITAVWMHPGGSQFDNVDMRIYDGPTLVASDLNTLNSYESVQFTAQAGRAYRLELTRVGTSVIPTLDVAIAGFRSAPVLPPSLTAINPAQTTNGALATITLDGSFDRIQSVDVGAMSITNFQQVSATRLTFTLPSPAEIGASLPVTVTNASGTSNQLALRIDGTHPMRISGVGIGLRGFPSTIDCLGDAGFSTLMFVSPSNQPSVLPGIVSLGIAANFSLLFEAGSFALDGRGSARAQFTLPASIPAGLYHFQAITFDLGALSAPLESSNVFTVNLF
ncbi:MAG: S8 family serine peptidase [Planctomycetes bacterium]|nr:S8 family serine peptidase [Planctomycetota bacterium]